MHESIVFRSTYRAYDVVVKKVHVRYLIFSSPGEFLVLGVSAGHYCPALFPSYSGPNRTTGTTNMWRIGAGRSSAPPSRVIARFRNYSDS